MLNGRKLLLKLIILTFIVSACNQKSENEFTSYKFFKNSSCDSTKIESEGDEVRYYCFKNGTKSILSLDREDTTFILRHQNSIHWESKNFKNGRVTKLIEGLTFEKSSFTNLKIVFSDNQLDKKNSFYFEFKNDGDSTYFRINPESEILEGVDSFYVSKCYNFYPTHGNESKIEYLYKEYGINNWNYLPEDEINNDKVAVMLLFKSDENSSLKHSTKGNDDVTFQSIFITNNSLEFSKRYGE